MTVLEKLLAFAARFAQDFEAPADAELRCFPSWRQIHVLHGTRDRLGVRWDHPLLAAARAWANAEYPGGPVVGVSIANGLAEPLFDDPDPVTGVIH